MVLEESSKPRRGAHRGVVFTPPELARRLVKPFACPSARGGPPLLDPACGDGELLLAALEMRGGGAQEARQLFGIEIDTTHRARALERLATASGLSSAELEPNVLLADALASGLRWPAECSIVANPPWLSFSGRHRGHGESPSALGGWPSLQGAFLDRIATYCAEHDGRARLLLPGSILELSGYEPLRRSVAERVHLAAVPEELGEKAFPGVIEPAVLLELAAGPGSFESPSTREAGPHQALLEQLASFPTLPDKTFADPGVHTGNSAALLVLEEASGDCAPLRRGADLGAFSLRPARQFLRLDLRQSAEQRFRIAALDHYAAFPVLLRQTADRPIAARHLEPTYFRNSLLGVREVPGLAPEFLVGLLNSKCAALWHRWNFRDARQRSFPQVKVGHLRTQPTPIRGRAEDPRLHDEVVGRVRDLESTEKASGSRQVELDRLFATAFGWSPQELDAYSL